jgi:hypothetical protein
VFGHDEDFHTCHRTLFLGCVVNSESVNRVARLLGEHKVINLMPQVFANLLRRKAHGLRLGKINAVIVNTNLFPGTGVLLRRLRLNCSGKYQQNGKLRRLLRLASPQNGDVRSRSNVPGAAMNSRYRRGAHHARRVERHGCALGAVFFIGVGLIGVEVGVLISPQSPSSNHRGPVGSRARMLTGGPTSFGLLFSATSMIW